MDGAHGARVQAPEAWFFNGDRMTKAQADAAAELAGLRWRADPDRIARVRVDLAASNPILWPTAAAAIERLFDYQSTSSAGNHLSEHAVHLLTESQRELHERRRAPLELAVARELALARKTTLEALIDTLGKKGAKETQIAVAVNRIPLAICVGTNVSRALKTKYGTLTNSYIGCLAVFDDVTRTSSKMWPMWCPDCRKRNGKPDPMKKQDRAFKRRVEAQLRDWSPLT
jgi:hypothetical protein